MASKGLWAELMSLSDAKLNSIVTSAIDEYYQLLTAIAIDIYDSCIKDYYRKYPNPVSYKRHGNIKGYNLYFANDISYDGDTVNVVIDEWLLLPYGKKSQSEKRNIVLDGVLAGLRGGPLPQHPEWPMDWYTSYPNVYSKYRGIWQSSEIVLQDILDDFCENVVKDTLPIVIHNIRKKL